jgi:hypothetical protein
VSSFLSNCGGRRDFDRPRRIGSGFAQAIHGADAHASFGLSCDITIAADRPWTGDGAYAEQRRDTACHVVGFGGRQLFCALAAQHSFVIVHAFSFLVSRVELSHRVAVFGSKSRIPGTDRQSVDVAADMLNFRRGQLACVLATQDSIVFVHSHSFFHGYFLCADDGATSNLR